MRNIRFSSADSISFSSFFLLIKKTLFSGITPTLAASSSEEDDIQTIDLDLGAGREGSRTGNKNILGLEMCFNKFSFSSEI